MLPLARIPDSHKPFATEALRLRPSNFSGINSTEQVAVLSFTHENEDLYLLAPINEQRQVNGPILMTRGSMVYALRGEFVTKKEREGLYSVYLPGIYNERIAGILLKNFIGHDEALKIARSGLVYCHTSLAEQLSNRPPIPQEVTTAVYALQTGQLHLNDTEKEILRTALLEFGANELATQIEPGRVAS